MAFVISCSSARNVDRREAAARRLGVFSRSVTMASRAARAARMQAATSSSERGESMPPIWASLSAWRMSGKGTIGCSPR